MRNEIKYLIGDATQPVGSDNKIICHICNNVGAWGAGFVLALSRRWKEPEMVYRQTNVRDLHLGTVITVRVSEDILVANMVAQNNIISNINDNEPPIRYDALKVCLAAVNDIALKTNSSLHMPRIGTGLAGGKWDEIEKIIKETITVDTYVYDLK